MTSLGNGTWFNGFNNFLSPDLTFALSCSLRGLVVVVHRIQLRPNQQELLHLEKILRLDRLFETRTVLCLKSVSQAAGSCVIARRVHQAVSDNLVKSIKSVMVFCFLVSSHLTVKISQHSLNRSARAQRKPVSMKWVKTRWHWGRCDEAGKSVC